MESELCYESRGYGLRFWCWEVWREDDHAGHRSSSPKHDAARWMRNAFDPQTHNIMASHQSNRHDGLFRHIQLIHCTPSDACFTQNTYTSSHFPQSRNPAEARTKTSHHQLPNFKYPIPNHPTCSPHLQRPTPFLHTPPLHPNTKSQQPRSSLHDFLNIGRTPQRLVYLQNQRILITFHNHILDRRRK